jgi:hypothetical protein
VLQFLGLDFSRLGVRAAYLAKDLGVTLTRSGALLGVREDTSGPGATIAPVEWTRAGSHLLREAWLELPVPCRHVWGIAISGPPGWIALDREFRPLSELRLCPADRIATEIAAWLATDTRFSRHCEAILFPKDWFRFAISRNLATDTTSASRSGLLLDAADEWDRAALATAGIDSKWLPPVFEPAVKTGRVAIEGATEAGLPDGLWLAAGSTRDDAALVAPIDLRTGTLACPAGDRRAVLLVEKPPGARDLAAEVRARVPEGFRVFRSTFSNHATLEISWPIDSAREVAIAEARSRLERAGFEVAAISESPGDAAVGVAAIAALASGLIKDWDGFYRRFRGPELPSPEHSPPG